MNPTAGVTRVGKRRTEPEPKRHGSLIRVSETFAEAIRELVAMERTSVAKFADAHLLPIVQKRYNAIIVQKARRIEGSKE
jgi:hypothetical protein